MKLHEALLSFLALSLIPFGERIRKVLSIVVPISVLILVLTTEDYRDTLLGYSGVRLIFDEGSKFFMIAGAVVFLGVALEKKSWKRTEYFLFCSSFLVIELLFMSGDLFNMYVMMEILSVQAGLMILVDVSPAKLWATLKYLMIGSVGANLYLLGVGMVYMNSGTFDITVLKGVELIPVTLMLLGLMVRSGVFGLGMWLPQFHTNAPKEISALLSAIFVEGGMYAYYRIVTAGLIEDTLWLEYGALIFVLGGSLMALKSRSFKGVLASSTMSHIGASFFNVYTVPLGVLAHSIVKAPLFLISDEISEKSVRISELVVIVVFILSLLGVYPTFGCAVKESMVKDTLSEFVVLLSYGLIGYSLFSHIKVVGVYRKIKIRPSLLLFFISLILLTSIYFPAFSPMSFIPLIISMGSLIVNVKLKLRFLEKLEELESNTLVVLIFVSLVVGVLWLSRF